VTNPFDEMAPAWEAHYGFLADSLVDSLPEKLFCRRNWRVKSALGSYLTIVRRIWAL
jgi:hypothetical protein